MRYYRVALPVSYTSCKEDFYGNAEDIKMFWSDVEEYLNRVYLPLGFCFKVCDDSRLIQSSYNIIDENFMIAPSYGTELLDDVIGTSAYDVGLWIVHRPEGSENTGLALTGGAYNPSYKAIFAFPRQNVKEHSKMPASIKISQCIVAKVVLVGK